MSFVSSAFSGAQNGFTAQSAYKPGTQATAQDFAPQIATANQNYGSANNTLDSLTQAIMARMQPGAPTLSGQLLSNATGANVANTAAAMAGQRGASQNVGLLRRQIGQQGANIQQQSIGQAAANQLAENQANINAATNVANTQGNLANSNLGIQQNAIAQQNSNILSDVQGRNTIGAQQAAQNAQANQGGIGGLANAAMSIAPLLLADGGAVSPGSSNIIPGFGTGSNFGFNFTSGLKPGTKPTPQPGSNPIGVTQRQGAGTGIRNPGGFDAGQGIGANVIPTTMIQGPMQNPIPQAAKGGKFVFDGRLAPLSPMNMTGGGTVMARRPQEKATIPGNSLKNDKIPAMVSEDEIVLPREVTMHPNAPAMAAKYVMEVMKGKHKVKV